MTILSQGQGLSDKTIATALEAAYAVVDLDMHGPQQTIHMTADTTGIDKDVADSLQRVGQHGDFFLVEPQFQSLFRRFVQRARREIITQGIFMRNNYLVPRYGTNDKGERVAIAVEVYNAINGHAADFKRLLEKLDRPLSQIQSDPEMEELLTKRDLDTVMSLDGMYQARRKAVLDHAKKVEEKFGQQAGNSVRNYLLPRLATVAQMKETHFSVHVNALTLHVAERDEVDRLIAETHESDSRFYFSELPRKIAEELAEAYDMLLREKTDLAHLNQKTRDVVSRSYRKALDHNVLGDAKITEAAEMLRNVLHPTVGTLMPDKHRLLRMKGTLDTMRALYRDLDELEDLSVLGGAPTSASPGSVPTPGIEQVRLELDGHGGHAL